MDYKCRACSKDCSNEANVYKHARLCSAGIKCPRCGQSVSSPQGLRRHMRAFHRDYKCSTCSKSFFLQEGRNNHERTAYHRNKPQRNAYASCSYSIQLPHTNLSKPTEKETLNDLIESVRPTPGETESLGEVVDEVVRFLHGFRDSYPTKDYRVDKVLKSGSLCKGTAVRHRMDVDLLVFMEAFSNMRSFRSKLPTILNDLRQYVKKHGSITVKDKDKYMLKCRLYHEGKWYDVDILPAMNVLASDKLLAQGNVWRRELYKEMGQLDEDSRSYYSVCLAELQKHFVKSKADGDSRIKDLVRLVKYWSKGQGLKIKSYCLELICIEVYQEARTSPVDVARLFKMVMQKLKNIQHLRIVFEDYYPKHECNSTTPYVMDPANPYNNVLPEKLSKRQGVATAADLTLQGKARNREFNFLTSV